ncbi:MAG: Pre-mRNA-splicing factor slt11 [Bathelium mastoideum]|nr:MAG: Pre-mRNA-splicing factor slt11 [Bathelium mastoideum]
MPPQIKQDLNRSGWESTDFPSVCERCLPANPYVQMIKEDYGAECKVCTRPFTVFAWKADRSQSGAAGRRSRTTLCLTCARVKNCCQCCMLDLAFGLPTAVRDAALRMARTAPESRVNREFFAQEHEREIEEGRGEAVEEHEKTDERARDLLRRLAESEPYYKRQRRLEASGEKEGEGGQKLLAAPGGEGNGEGLHRPGPMRTRDSRGGRGGRGGGGGGMGARGGRTFPSAAQLPPGPQDIAPPADKNITSLFVTGVEDDLPEHEIRTHFGKFGKLRSVVCSHRSHCAFINYMTRHEAEAAAEACQGKAVVAAVPLRVQWGKPKVLDTMDREQRIAQARAGRDTARAVTASTGGTAGSTGVKSSRAAKEAEWESLSAVAPPPGADDVQYASLAGD